MGVPLLLPPAHSDPGRIHRVLHTSHLAVIISLPSPTYMQVCSHPTAWPRVLHAA